MYTNSEDGLYGPAVDNDFATNRWVYLFYAPLAMDAPYPPSTPGGAAPLTPQADPSAWDAWKGYFQLSRFKFVDGENPTLDLSSEQKILKVDNNRGACCHVAGDIDFDRHNNLWLVTGDDTPAGGGNSGGFAPFNAMLTNETQTVRTAGASGGTFTLTFQGQTTAPIAYNATFAQVQAALEELEAIGAGDVLASGGPVNTSNVSVGFRGAFSERNVAQISADGSGLTGTAAGVQTATSTEGGLYQPPWLDARRTALNTNDLRGKILRITVAADGSYTVPAGNLFPESEDADGKTRPEIYAMGFRNPFRIQVDKNDVAYVTDYSPDSSVPGPFRGPAGTGRLEIVRKPANYGWPLCYRTDLPYYKWDFNTSTTLGEQYECGAATHGPENTSRWNTGRTITPPITNPDVWYSFQDATGARRASTATTPRRPGRARGSGRAGHRRRRSARRDEVRLRPGQPEHDEAAAVLRRRGPLRRVHPRLSEGDPARLGRQGPQDQPALELRRGRLGIAAVRVRQPDGPADRGRRQLLPADLRRRLLRRQRGRGHVPLRLRQGPARAAGRAGRHADRWAGAADGGLLERGLARPRSR